MKEQITNLKEVLTQLNNHMTKIIERLDNANDEKKLNIYRDTIWEITKQIRNTVGSPNSRKN